MAKGHEQHRREFLKQAATAAWATPLILTVTSGGAYAQSCIPEGSTCADPVIIGGVHQCSGPFVTPRGQCCEGECRFIAGFCTCA